VKWQIYLDESGDHGLKRFDPHYPVFVLSAVLIKERKYDRIKEELRFLKQRYWGRSDFVFHSREIRRREGLYRSLEDKYESFLEDLTELIEEFDFTVIAAVIDKIKLVNSYPEPFDPYELALRFLMERIAIEVGPNYPRDLWLHLEGRGKREDRKLLGLALRFRDGIDQLAHQRSPGLQKTMSKIRIKFYSKNDLIDGLQLADLVAWPIGRQYLNPSRRSPSYRPFQVIKAKMRRGPQNKLLGYGLKIFPNISNEELERFFEAMD